MSGKSLAKNEEFFLSSEGSYSFEISNEYIDLRESPCTNRDTLSSMTLETSGNVLSLTGFSPYTTPTLNARPEIINEIQNFPIEIEVTSKAIEIYYETVNKNKNSSNRPIMRSYKETRKARLIFYCIFIAYRDVGYPVDPCYVAEVVNLPINKINRAISEYAPPGTILIEPEKMIRFYIVRINQLLSTTNIHYNEDLVIAGAQKVLSECKSTDIGKEWIQNTTAKSVAIASLYFYMNDIRGIRINQNIIEKACYLSWACIRRHHEQVAKYYNCSQKDYQQPAVSWNF